MLERKRAIIFGVAGAVMLIVGAVGLVSVISDDDDGEIANGPTAPGPSTSTSPSPIVTTTQVSTATTQAPTTSAAVPSTTSAPTVVATSTTVPAPTTIATTTTQVPTTTTTIALEDPEEFVTALIAAQASGDINFLLARLHPEVLTRYGGVDPCQTYLGSVDFPAITLREIADPAPWDFATDDLVTTVPEAIGVEIQRLVDGETIIQELHIAYSGPELRWFTDCGDPV